MFMRITVNSLGRTGRFSRICNHIHSVNTSKHIGTLYFYVYLKILVPDTSTYNVFVTMFEIT